jgi:hypothetical protein
MSILEVLTAVLMNIRVFCNVMSSHLVKRYRRAEGQQFLFQIYGQPVQENISGIAGNVGKHEPVDSE